MSTKTGDNVQIRIANGDGASNSSNIAGEIDFDKKVRSIFVDGISFSGSADLIPYEISENGTPSTATIKDVIDGMGLLNVRLMTLEQYNQLIDSDTVDPDIIYLIKG